MDPFLEAKKAIEKALEGSEIYRAMRSMQEALRPERFPAMREMMRAREEMEKYFSSLSQSAVPKWDIDSDPNVPAEFKRTYKSLLQASPKHRKKVVAIWSFIAHKNPKALIAPLRAANSPTPEFYSLKANAICQYLKLAKEHYRLGLGPVTKGELWDQVCEIHVAIHKSGRPTHRALILGQIGLGPLPERPRGRPRK